MSNLKTPEADFYEILQVRINELQKILDDNESTDQEFRRVLTSVTKTSINELKYLQTNFNSYMYKIRTKKQAD